MADADLPLLSPIVTKVRPQVLADGTYATQAAVANAPAVSTGGEGGVAATPRSLLLAGDMFLASVIAVTLVKLILRLRDLPGVETPVLRRRTAEALLAMVAMLRYGELRAAAAAGDAAAAAPPGAACGGGGGAALTLDRDARDRIFVCISMLQSPPPESVALWTSVYRDAYAAMLEERRSRDVAEANAAATATVTAPDELVDFAHLKHRKGVSQIELEDEVAMDLQRATGLDAGGAAVDGAAGGGTGGARGVLRRTLQLTGLSDAVYAEAVVIVHQYDVVLDVTVINRTKATLQNLCLELATMGDLKLVERPQNHTLAAGETRRLRANIKVSSTETGVIFGNIVYEAGGTGEAHVVVLADIHIDIMDYIAPAPCADVAFRNFWAEFEWENKVAINTDISDPKAFLDHIVKQTNMKCLNPPSSLAGDCGYLSANLYAKSVFGEDALVNLSVEKTVEGRLIGFLRIRAKSQGIALSLGDKITLKQKSKD